MVGDGLRKDEIMKKEKSHNSSSIGVEYDLRVLNSIVSIIITIVYRMMQHLGCQKGIEKSERKRVHKGKSLLLNPPIK